MKKLSPFVLLAVLVVTIWACKKELSNENNRPDPNPPVEMVQTSIQGRVLDEQQQPVEGAAVTSGGRTATTDVNGTFLLEKVNVNKDAAVVNVKKDGYFNGSRTLLVEKDGLYYAQIALLPKNTAATFTSTAGGTVQLPHGSMTFVPNQVLKDNNQPYSGTVNVAFAYLDPESDHFDDIMPGDLRGIDRNNAQVGLKSFGMIAVELQGENGELLHLDTNKTVTIRMNIPTSLQNSAPAQIPLWYFDENGGLWKEEGSASRQGSVYVGTVKHFSFWNCDAPFPLVELTGKVLDQQGAPVPYMQVVIQRKADFSPGYGYTDANGSFTGKVPANAELILSVTDHCETLIHKQEIGPFSKNADLGAVNITLPTANVLRIEGTAVDCNNSPVAEGVVKISLDGLHYAAVIDKGDFSMSISRCSSTQTDAEFGVFDAATQAFAVSTLPVTTGTVKPALIACGAVVDNYVNISINGKTALFTAPQDLVELSIVGMENVPDSTITIAASRNGFGTLFADVASLKLGTQSSTYFLLALDSAHFWNSGPAVVTVNVTSSGGSGLPFKGTFGGSALDSTTSKIYPVTGSFSIKR